MKVPRGVCCLQVGGMWINGGQVTLTTCNIYNNVEGGVRIIEGTVTFIDCNIYGNVSLT